MSKEENVKLINAIKEENVDVNSPKNGAFKSPEITWKDYFPYEPRLDQEGIAEFVKKNIVDKGVCIVEAPYGTGKSIAMISAALASGKKVVFATCNNAAHNSIVDEVLRINQRFDKNLTVASIIGKGKLCLQDDFTYDLCEQLRKAAQCKFYNGTYNPKKAERELTEKTTLTIKEIEHTVKKRPYELLHTPFSKFVNAKALEHGVCPYELMLKLSERADVIIVDYFHIFTILFPFSKSRMGIVPKDSVLFVDEADEVKDRMLSALTKSVSYASLERLKEQVKKTPGVTDEDMTFLDDFMKIFHGFFDGKSGHFDLNKDEIIRSIDLKLCRFDDFLSKMENITSLVSKEHERVAVRPENWFELLAMMPAEQFCHGYKDDLKETFSISNYELQTAELMELEGRSIKMKDMLEEFHSSVLFSATIGNVEIFKKGIGIEYADFFSSSKFNTSNFQIILKKDVSSLYKTRKETAAKIIDDVKFCTNVSEGLLVALPSTAASYDIVPHIGAHSLDLVKECKSNGVYYAVLGGRSSRGINKAHNLSTVYIYGLQLPPMDDYLFLKRKDYLIKKYQRDVAYKFLYQNVVSKACQTAGRIFRTKSKKGLVIFADSRYKWDPMQGDFFNKCFPAYFRDKILETSDKKSFDLAVSSFWGKLTF